MSYTKFNENIPLKSVSLCARLRGACEAPVPRTLQRRGDGRGGRGEGHERGEQRGRGVQALTTGTSRSGCAERALLYLCYSHKLHW
jgi:hypothetical protein